MNQRHQASRWWGEEDGQHSGAGQLEFRGGVWVEGPEFPCELSVLKNSTPPKSQTFPHAYQHLSCGSIKLHTGHRPQAPSKPLLKL